MSFDWMDAARPAGAAERGAKARRAQCVAEIRERAALLRRLGHDHDYTLRRCITNQAWAWESSGTPPVSEDEIRAMVGGVYGLSG